MSSENTAQGDVAAAQQRRKLIARRTAEFAIAGFELVELPTGDFLVARWGLASKPLPDFEAIEAFARMVGIRIEPA